MVGGTVTPDTFMVDKQARAVTETVLGPKEQKIISDGAQGVVEVEVSDAEREASSLSPEMLKDLIDTAIAVEGLYDGLPQDIEWGFSGGVLHMLQSRPITLLPPDPEHPDIDLTWTPRAPARFLTRRQIVENMPVRPSQLADDGSRMAAPSHRRCVPGPDLSAVRGALPDARARRREHVPVGS